MVDIGVSVGTSDALVVDCALTGLLLPAPPAGPAFPVRPLAQTAGHANPTFPLMFSRKEEKAQGLRFQLLYCATERRFTDY